jgi:predicted membrane protein
MKTRNLFLFVIALLAYNAVQAQDYKIPVAGASSLKLENFSGTLTIEGYSGNEIIISPAEASEPIPERAKGLKPIYSLGTDNTGIGLAVEKEENRITVKCLLSFANSKEFTMKVPENLAVSIASQCENSNEIFISKIKNEIEIQNCFSITLEQVTGPLVLSTISGDINVNLSAVNTQKPFAISSVSGEIDVTLPAKLGADIEMGSVTGTMYSDFDFSNSDKDMKRVGGNQLNYKMNGGGLKFNIVTVSGNIYLRKGA